MDKVTEEFEYACEAEKKKFQSSISSLLELQSVLEQKRIRAMEGGYDKAMIPTEEMEIYKDWILDLVGHLMEAYGRLDRMNRNSFRMIRCSDKIRQMTTPSLKGLNQRVA